jgi:predicted nucleic acid-binding Zn ribbon protein
MKCIICGRETNTDSSICSDCGWEYEEPPECYGGD